MIQAIPFRALLIGALYCCVFSWIAVVSYNNFSVYMPSTQISSMAFIFLPVLVLLINPLFRLFRLKGLNKGELAIVATMAIVPSGLLCFGFMAQTLPMVGYTFNPKYSDTNSKYFIKDAEPKLYLQFDENSDKNWDGYNKGIRVRDEESFPIFVPKPDGLGNWPREVAEYVTGQSNRSLMGDVPWGDWIGPLSFWCLFLFIAVAIFFSLNHLLFKQWYENEKLVFPHAELIGTVLGMEDKKDDKTPSLYKSFSTWVGFAVSFLVMFYQGSAQMGWPVTGLSKMALKGEDTDISKFMENSIFHGATPDIRLSIFFVVMGLAFLLPAEITLSIWGFFIFMKFQQLVAVEMGYGESGASFNADSLTTANFMTAQGGGAMIVFGLVALYKVRHNLLAFFYRLAFPKGLKRYSAEEIKENSVASLIFFVSSIAFIGFFIWVKVTWMMAIIIWLMVILMTISMVRLVSEGGLLGFQIWFGPFHIIKNFGLLKFATFFQSNSIINGLPLYNSIFVDTKSYMAPMLMTCRSVAERAKLSFSKFALAVFLGIAITLAFGIVTSVSMLYDKGAGGMDKWFFVSAPQYNVRNINSIMSNTEDFKEVNPEIVGWSGVGGFTMGLMLLARRVFFWCPHPIGLLMYVNPFIKAYWFSFFLAWVFKSFAVKYARPQTYRMMKYFFIGLILGELLIVVISTLLSIGSDGDLKMKIDLNRPDRV